MLLGKGTDKAALSFALASEYEPPIVQALENNAQLKDFLTNSKNELPTKSSTLVGGMVNICNKNRVANLATVYLGAVLDINMTSLLDYLYDRYQTFVYPSESGTTLDIAF